MKDKILYVHDRETIKSGGSYPAYENPISYGFMNNGAFKVKANNGAITIYAPGEVVRVSLVDAW